MSYSSLEGNPAETSFLLLRVGQHRKHFICIFFILTAVIYRAYRSAVVWEPLCAACILSYVSSTDSNIKWRRRTFNYLLSYLPASQLNWILTLKASKGVPSAPPFKLFVLDFCLLIFLHYFVTLWALSPSCASTSDPWCQLPAGLLKKEKVTNMCSVFSPGFFRLWMISLYGRSPRRLCPTRCQAQWRLLQ